MAAQPVAPRPPAPPSDTLRNRSLYVGDLDPEVTEMDLVQAFRQMGPLASVRLCRDRFSHQSLRYAYINFFSPSDASKALACLNHTELKAKPMRIMWCQRDPLTRKTGIGNIFIKNLDPSVTSTHVQGMFCKFGTILSCKVAEEHGKSKGFGFVQFDSQDSSMAAINTLHGTMLEGKKLYVSKFVKKSERKDAHEEPNFTNLYIKNLGENVTKDALRDEFSEFGKVCNVLIMKDAEGKSRGFGFVNFKSHEDAKKAVEALNGALLGSKKLFVGKAQKKAEREEYEEITNHYTDKPKASNLYVKNLDASIDDGKLEAHFSAFGKVTSAKVMRHESGISKGFGFVSFSTPEEAKNALDILHGTIFQGRSLYVAVAQCKAERSRELESYYAQHPLQPVYSPNSDILTPLFHPTYYNFPPFPSLNPASCINSCPSRIYQHLDRSVGALYPFMAQHYQRNVSPYIPVRQSQQGTNLSGVYHHTMGYPSSIVPTGELNYGSRKDQKISRNKKAGAAEAASIGSAAKSKENIKEGLYPLVGNLQPGHVTKITEMVLEKNNSDVRKLLNSPKH